jgi:hypothetical protein
MQISRENQWDFFHLSGQTASHATTGLLIRESAHSIGYAPNFARAQDPARAKILFCQVLAENRSWVLFRSVWFAQFATPSSQKTGCGRKYPLIK